MDKKEPDQRKNKLLSYFTQLDKNWLAAGLTVGFAIGFILFNNIVSALLMALGLGFAFDKSRC